VDAAHGCKDHLGTRLQTDGHTGHTATPTITTTPTTIATTSTPQPGDATTDNDDVDTRKSAG
jgi:hypothetical protein